MLTICDDDTMGDDDDGRDGDDEAFLESLVASLFLKIPRGVVWCDRELGIGLDLNDQS